MAIGKLIMFAYGFPPRNHTAHRNMTVAAEGFCGGHEKQKRSRESFPDKIATVSLKDPPAPPVRASLLETSPIMSSTAESSTPAV